MSTTLLLSSISNPNWILGSSRVEAALLNKLALGAIISFLRFVGIVRFSFNSGGIGLVLFGL